WIYLINNFAHDLFTGIWFGSFIGLYVCHAQINELAQPSAAITSFTAKLQGHFFFLGALSLVLVMLTGLVRFLYRRDWDKMENPGKLKKPILIVKHAFLGTAFIIGSAYAIIWTF
ncbi:MAG: hypothetical protein OEL55_05570, partial [Desulfobulbaceae bacterium]|nr:hypothetical protein [Desulfobulbaceae bacterium]